MICAFCRSVRCMAGIREPGLNWIGSSIQAFRFSGVLEIAPAARVVAAHQVRQVGTESSVGHRARDGVAVDARLLFEDEFSAARVDTLTFRIC